MGHAGAQGDSWRKFWCWLCSVQMFGLQSRPAEKEEDCGASHKGNASTFLAVRSCASHLSHSKSCVQLSAGPHTWWTDLIKSLASVSLTANGLYFILELLVLFPVQQLYCKLMNLMHAWCLRLQTESVPGKCFLWRVFDAYSCGSVVVSVYQTNIEVVLWASHFPVGSSGSFRAFAVCPGNAQLRARCEILLKSRYCV